ncbi:MAG TPA: Shedu immune nuclease family protein [Pyrinomonadaceae bacterium]
MSDHYKLHSTSNQSATVETRVLSRTSITQLALMSEIVQNPNQPEASVKITLVHQRKAKNGLWENEMSVPLSALRAGEAKKFSLNSEQTFKLHNELLNLYTIGDGIGVQPGNLDIIVTERNKAAVITSLLSQGYADDIWAALAETNPDLVTRLSYAQIQLERRKALELFQDQLSEESSENFWQEFFESNKWIFGYGLNYQILETVETQPRYGGTRVDGRGMQKGDFLQRTSAEIKFTVLVEIKKPDTQLVGRATYRNGAHDLGSELIGGVSQLHANCSKWEKEGAQTEENRERLSGESTYTLQPKGILVIGHTSQLDTISKRNSFELFRRNLSNPEIITFDELFERARFILEHTDTQDTVPKPVIEEGPEYDIDIPF